MGAKTFPSSLWEEGAMPLAPIPPLPLQPPMAYLGLSSSFPKPCLSSA